MIHVDMSRENIYSYTLNKERKQGLKFSSCYQDTIIWLTCYYYHSSLLFKHLWFLQYLGHVKMFTMMMMMMKSYIRETTRAQTCPTIRDFSSKYCSILAPSIAPFSSKWISMYLPNRLELSFLTVFALPNAASKLHGPRTCSADSGHVAQKMQTPQRPNRASYV